MAWDAAAATAADAGINKPMLGADPGMSEPGAATPPQGSPGQPGGVPPSQPATAANTATAGAGAQPGASGQGAPQQPAPVVLTPAKRGGLLGLIDSMADVLAGRTRPELAKGSDGQMYVKQQTLTRGQQWTRIIGGAVEGAAAGLAAGRGAGNKGKAALAGVQMGEHIGDKQHEAEKEMTAEARQQNLDNANYQMLRMQIAENAWKATRLGVEATQHDVEFAEQQQDRLVKEGGQVLGTVEHPGDIGRVLKVNPDLMADMIKRHLIQIVPNVEADGTRAGFTIIKMPAGYRSQLLPPGTVFHTFDPTTGQYVEHHSADPITAGEIEDYETKAGSEALKFKSDQQEAELKTAQTKEANARAEIAPTEAEKNRAEAGAANARAAATRSGETNPDGSPNAAFEAMAQALYDGDVLPSELKREAKGAGLDPNALMARAVQIGQERGKPWSEPIIEQEHRFAENEKTQAALDGINRITDPQTGYMQQMLTLARQAHLGTSGAFNSAGLAIRRFFGETSSKNFDTAVSELRRSIAGLIGNPLLGGGETDKKLEQAEELLGKSPTMANLESASKILTTALQTQKQSIIGNNRFLQKRYGTAAPASASPIATTPPNPSPSPTAGPPQAVIDATPEGQYMHSPDGKQTYRKVQGKAVPVQGNPQ